MKSGVLILVVWVLLFSACDDKLDAFADYEENASVFAMLDPSQDIQYVKINKVFTSPNGSAFDVAKIGDSLYFDSLRPTLTEIETGRVIHLLRYNLLQKANGNFANSPNYLYATAEKIFAADPQNVGDFYHYRLDFDLPSGKKHISATTNIPDSIVLLGPANIASGNAKQIDFTPTGSIRLTFQAPSYARIFDAYFYFHYQEINKQDTNIKTDKFFRFRMIPNYRAYDDHSHEQVSVPITTDIFYTLLMNNVKPDPLLMRRFMPCKLELTGANQEFDNYFQATTPSIGIVQKQTEYTNVVNGVGLFASRRISRYHHISIGPYTKKIITTDSVYSTLGFMKP